MVINNEEIKLKITPRALEIVENKFSEFNIVEIYINAKEGKTEPKISDYNKLIYAGYIGATGNVIEYDDFLKMIEDKSFFDINNEGINLLVPKKK